MAESKGLGPNAKFIGVKGSRTQLSTPNLLLDLDALERNIAAMAAHTKTMGLKLRPHSKGAKSIEIGKRQIEARAAERTKSAAHSLLTDPALVATSLQIVRIVGVKRLLPILAVGGLALGLLASRSNAGDQAPAE